MLDFEGVNTKRIQTTSEFVLNVKIITKRKKRKKKKLVIILNYDL